MGHPASRYLRSLCSQWNSPVREATRDKLGRGVTMPGIMDHQESLQAGAELAET